MCFRGSFQSWFEIVFDQMAIIDSVHFILNNQKIEKLVLKTSSTLEDISFLPLSLDANKKISVFKLLPNPIVTDR